MRVILIFIFKNIIDMKYKDCHFPKNVYSDEFCEKIISVIKKDRKD